jgi:predicted Fe-Mo cluster-binding NifX family protein
MKIWFTAWAFGQDATVNSRFGRRPFFTIVNADGMTVESIPNSGATSSGGAGIQAAQALAGLGVTALITGNVGPNALQTLSAAGIDPYQKLGGSVREAAEQFKQGELQKITTPSVSPHAGMGRGQTGQGPQGQGRGGGRGRGGPGAGKVQRSSGGQGAGRGGRGSGQGAGRGTGVGGTRGGRGQ